MERKPEGLGRPQANLWPHETQPKPNNARSLTLKHSDPSSLGLESSTDGETEISFISEEDKNQEGKSNTNPKIKNKENLRIMQWNMQRCTIAELERVAKEYNADIITAQETGIENSQVIETKDYIFFLFLLMQLL